MKNVRQNSGFTLISTVLVIAAVVLTISTTVSLLAIGEAQTSFALYRGEDSLQFVEGCAEDALLKKRSNNAYAGGTITRPEGTCNVTITASCSSCTMTVTTSDTRYKRTVEVIFTRSGTGITLTSWREI